LTFQKEVLSTFEEFTLNHKVYFGDNNIFDVCEKDTIVFNLPNRISKCIGDVLYVPKLAKNCQSINQLTKKGFKVEFENTKCWLKSFNSNKVIIKAIQEERLYKLIGISQFLVGKCSTKIKRSDLWHQRLRHNFM
jgi:hypothetical protein